MPDDEGKCIHCFDADANKAFAWGGEVDELAGKVLLWVWDDRAEVLDWVRLSRSMFDITLEGDLTVSMGDVERLLADQYYKRSKYYYDANDNLEYLCQNTDIDANETDTDWFCWKFTWTAGSVSGFNATTKEGPLQGAVDVAPAALAWNT